MSIFLSLTPEEYGVYNRVLTAIKGLAVRSEVHEVVCLAITNDHSGRVVFYNQQGIYCIESLKDQSDPKQSVLKSPQAKIFRYYNPELNEIGGTEEKKLYELKDTPAKNKKIKQTFYEYEPAEFEFIGQEERIFWILNQQCIYRQCTVENQQNPGAMYVMPSDMTCDTTNQAIPITIRDSEPSKSGIFFERMRIAIPKSDMVTFLYLQWLPNVKVMLLRATVGRLGVLQIVTPIHSF